MGHEAIGAGTAARALEVAEQRDIEVVLLDLGLPDMGGLDLLPRLLQIDESLAVVVVTGESSIASVVEAMKLGAQGFLAKPVTVAAIEAAVAQAVREHRLRRHAAVYHARVSCQQENTSPDELVGSSAAMQRVFDLILKVASTDTAVVLTGESGTGKGVVARMIHRYSRRAHGPFVDVSCAALPGNLLESEVFGHERGAFTDAKRTKPGLMEVAHGGTLFLDEVGELDWPAQAKLLKALEEGRFRRVGGVRDLRADVRLVVATHRDLAALVGEGRFRHDLFFRLNVFEISLPPLRARGEADIVQLANHFIYALNARLGKRVRRLREPAVQALVQHSWPGNVRELRNAIERAMILVSGDEVELHHLPADLWQRGGVTAAVSSQRLDELEASHIRAVVAACQGNLKLAAQRLGVARSTLYAKMSRFGLRPGCQ